MEEASDEDGEGGGVRRDEERRCARLSRRALRLAILDLGSSLASNDSLKVFKRRLVGVFESSEEESGGDGRGDLWVVGV